MPNPQYTDLVDQVLALAARLKFRPEDFADLALAAADQAGLDGLAQDHMASALGVEPYAMRPRCGRLGG